MRSKFPDICFTVEEKSRKRSQSGKRIRPGIEPGPAKREARMLPLDQSGGLKENEVLLLLQVDNHESDITVLAINMA